MADARRQAFAPLGVQLFIKLVDVLQALRIVLLYQPVSGIQYFLRGAVVFYQRDILCAGILLGKIKDIR